MRNFSAKTHILVVDGCRCGKHEVKTVNQMESLISHLSSKG